MKSNAKSKIIVLITLGILFALSSIFSNKLSFNMRNSDNSTTNSIDFNLGKENPKISKVSGPISITGNSGWSTAKSIGICTGNGIYSDPYVIEDLVIVSGGSEGIRISSSNVYFKIENCTVSNYYDGISLVNVNNGQLINNNATNNSNYGIYLENSNNNAISGNTVNNNGDGIVLDDNNNNNTISGNTVINNEWGGIGLTEGDDNIISGNTASKNFWGLYILYSNSNTISGNTLNNNTYGMELWYSDYSTVSGNVANGNDWVGIMLRDNHDNTVSGNIANYNNKLYAGIGAGIALWESCYNDVSENNANDNLYSGIYLYSNCSDNNIISGNTANNNGNYGIIVDEDNSGNNIYLNCFNNTLNAIDNGSNNHWDNGNQGNYWADYTGLDADGNGIGDVPYNISGSAGSKDNFPLMKCPSPTSQGGGGIPIELIILISVISGGAVIGVATLLLIIRKRKRIE